MSSDIIRDEAIRRAARRLRIAVFAATGVVFLIYLSARFGLGFGPFRFEYKVHGASLRSAQLVADGTMLLLAVALARLIQMLGLIAAGQTFSVDVIRRFRSFALWLLLMAVLGFLGPVVAALAQVQTGEPHKVAFAFQLREFLTVGITLLLFLLARLLERARELEAEMREIV